MKLALALGPKLETCTEGQYTQRGCLCLGGIGRHRRSSSGNIGPRYWTKAELVAVKFKQRCCTAPNHEAQATYLMVIPVAIVSKGPTESKFGIPHRGWVNLQSQRPLLMRLALTEGGLAWTRGCARRLRRCTAHCESGRRCGARSLALTPLVRL